MRSIFTTNRTALVTGASAGIGLEVAKALAPKLDSLILAARRVERLEEVAKELQSRFPALRVAVQPVDLSAPPSVEDFLGELKACGGEIDVLVNSAGLGEFELFERSSWSRIHRIVEVNIVALLRLTHHLLPAMVSRGHGAVLNIGSGAGYAAMPNAAVYTASKHFVRAFTESLRAQLAGAGIIVSEAAPGPVDTEFDQVAGVEGEVMPGQSIMRISAPECAAEIVREFEKGSPVIFPGRTYHLLMRMQPLMPRRLLAAQVTQAARKIRNRQSA
jgi:short-subunit dehydrogenase